MHAQGETVIEAGLARGQVAESVALGAGSVLGGLLPGVFDGLPQSGDGIIRFSVPFVVAGAMMLAYAVAASLLLSAEGPRERASVSGTVAVAVRRALVEAPVRRVMAVAMCLGVVLSGVELLAPNTFADLLGGATRASGLYGVLTAAAFAVAALGAGMSIRVPGRRTAVAAVSYATAAGMVLLVAAPSVGIAASAFLLLYLLIGVQGPVMAGLLHDRADSSVRSTMMSVESLSLQAGGVGASLLVGALASGVGLVAGLCLVAAAALVAATVLGRDLHHHTV